MKFLLIWGMRILPFLYMIAIWVLSSMPADAVVKLPDSTIDGMIKESLHLVEFALLYLFLVAALLTTERFSRRWNLFCALFACFYGVLDEVHQYFVPYRSATFIDVVKDVAGVTVAYYFVRKRYMQDQLRSIRSMLRFNR